MNEETEMLVVKSKIKAYASDNNFRTSETFLDELNKEVYRLIDRAMDRAHAAKRGTLKDQDA